MDQDQDPSFAIFMIFIQVNLSEAYIALLDVVKDDYIIKERYIEWQTWLQK